MSVSGELVIMGNQVMFVASSGGHLEELKRLRRNFVDADTRITWVTADSPQSRWVLRDERDVHWVRDVGPRGYLSLVLILVPALLLLRRVRPAQVYSTGAAIALAFLPVARLFGARATYIESATRTSGPSLTGRLLAMVPWIALRTQYRSWAGRRWIYGGSVFDNWAVLPVPTVPARIRRVVVTLGTQVDYPFLSLVERLQQIIPADVEVRWQVGVGFPEHSRPAGARDLVSGDELRDWVSSADAVVAHAGVGSALTLLGSGRAPVLVPRMAGAGEHVDDHQAQLAQELLGRGLAVVSSAAELTWDDVVRSTTVQVVRALPPEHVSARTSPPFSVTAA